MSTVVHELLRFLRNSLLTRDQLKPSPTSLLPTSASTCGHRLLVCCRLMSDDEGIETRGGPRRRSFRFRRRSPSSYKAAFRDSRQTQEAAFFPSRGTKAERREGNAFTQQGDRARIHLKSKRDIKERQGGREDRKGRKGRFSSPRKRHL